jgi:DNA invertase Pin-like site-specific DNA recombinase
MVAVRGADRLVGDVEAAVAAAERARSSSRIAMSIA